MEPSASDKSSLWLKRPSKKYALIGASALIGAFIGDDIMVIAFGQAMTATVPLGLIGAWLAWSLYDRHFTNTKNTKEKSE